MTSRPRLLFVSPRFLYPTDSGGKIRTTQILRGLKGGAFDLTLLMPASQDEIGQWSGEIERACDRLVTWPPSRRGPLRSTLQRTAGLAGSLPVPVQSDWDPAGARAVENALAERPNVVVFDFPHSVVLAPPRIDVPSVLFTHNVEAEIFKRHIKVAKTPLHRWVWKSQYQKMLRFERESLRRFDVVVAVSERDAEFFRDDFGVQNSRPIPTGVDTEFYSWTEPQGEPQVVFCGSMDWMANIDGISYFSESVWPLIAERVPDARMKVVGRAPPEALRRKVVERWPTWEFTGFVDDVRDHIPGSQAFVIPLRVGGGTRIKAFEAMAMGPPVVSTSIGIEGLPVEPGREFLRGDSAAEFADAVVAVLEDQALASELSRNARELVVKNYGFRKAAKVFEDCCLAATESFARGNAA